MQYLLGCVVYDFFGGQITFVANQQLINGLAGKSVDFLKPLFDVVKGLPGLSRRTPMTDEWCLNCELELFLHIRLS